MDASRPAGFGGAVGERWVLRHRLPDGSATDLTGWVETVDTGEVGVVDRHGSLIRVARPAILAARRLPLAYGGRDPRRTSAAELARITGRAWVADAEPLGEWLLRAGGGFTARANSALAVGDPGLPFAAAVAQVIAYAHAAGIPPLVQVVADSEPEREFLVRGWRVASGWTDVLAVRLTTLLGEEPPEPGVEVSELLTPEWLAAYRMSRPSSAEPDLIRRILTGSPPCAFAAAAAAAAAAQEGQRVAAIGRGQVTAEWLGLSAVWTEAAARGQGWATRITRGLGAWGARLGARSAYLQVAAENAPALRAYQGLGFSPHHRYRYLAPP